MSGHLCFSGDFGFLSHFNNRLAYLFLVEISKREFGCLLDYVPCDVSLIATRRKPVGIGSFSSISLSLYAVENDDEALDWKDF